MSMRHIAVPYLTYGYSSVLLTIVLIIVFTFKAYWHSLAMSLQESIIELCDFRDIFGRSLLTTR